MSLSPTGRNTHGASELSRRRGNSAVGPAHNYRWEEANLEGRIPSAQVHNYQRLRPVNTRLLLRITRALLKEVLGKTRYLISVQVVGTAEIIRLNETFLRHAGPTDVIAFDYGDSSHPNMVYGEVFVCVDTAVQQAPRFGATWQSELVRYLVHGILHLCGFDDRKSGPRRRMKLAEDEALKRLSVKFFFGKIAANPGKRVPASTRHD